MVFSADIKVLDNGIDTDRHYYSTEPNEYIDPFKGELTLVYTDLTLPGNAGLDLQINRLYSSWMTSAKLALGYGWDIQFGKVIKKNANLYRIKLGDGKLYYAYKNGQYYYTKDFWKLDDTGGKITLFTNDGTQYVFDHTKYAAAQQLLTKISRFGNDISINYHTDHRIDYVIDTVGRKIFFDWEEITEVNGLYQITFKVLNSISYCPDFPPSCSEGGRIKVKYLYENKNDLIFPRELRKVQPPEGAPWIYTKNDHDLEITTPFGAIITYDYEVFSKPRGAGVDQFLGVSQKTIKGQGLQEGNWTYNYYGSWATWDDFFTVSDSCNRTTTYKLYGYTSSYGSNECYKMGLTKSITVQDGASQTIESEQIFKWDKLPIALSPAIHEVPYVCLDTDTYVPVQTEQTILRDGQSYTILFQNYDDYGNPRKLVETGDSTRTKDITYWYNTSANLLKDYPKTITVTGNDEFTGSLTAKKKLL